MKKFQLRCGLVLVALVVSAGIISLFWTPFDPIRVVAEDKLLSPGWPHLLGTDGMGIDIVSQLLVGARLCLVVSIVSVSIAVLIGVPLGIFAGQVGGWLDEAIGRLTDIAYAFPALLLAILLAAAFGGSTVTAMVAIGIATIPAFARVARAGTLQVLASDYVLAAKAAGTSRPGITIRHIAPNIAPLVGVQASVGFAMAILAEASLSYLGLGTPRPTPTWGTMLSDAQGFLFTTPTLALWPGLAIVLAVLGFNMLGDGLRDYLDPRLREAL